MLTEADIRAASVAAMDARHGPQPATLADARLTVLHLTHHVLVLVEDVRRLQRQSPAEPAPIPVGEGVVPTPGGRGWLRLFT